MSISGAQILDEAKKFLGDPYVYTAAGPNEFDCSGLVQYTLKQLGISAPRTSEDQWAWVTKVKESDLQTGDLIFSQWPGDNASPGHVGIYAGNNQVLEASTSSEPVHIVPYDSNYKAHTVGYGRVPGSAGGGSGGGGGGLLGDLVSLVIPQPMQDFFNEAEKIAQGVMWLVNPENWARILAGVMGFFLAAFGIGFLLWSAA